MTDPNSSGSRGRGDPSAQVFSAVRTLLDAFEADHRLNAAADAAADAIAGGGLVHVFGTGHSTLATQDTWPRIGGYVGWNPIVELAVSQFAPTSGVNGLLQATFLEKVEGYGRMIVESQPMAPPDALVVISHSGINAVPIEVAMLSRERGVRVVAITCVAQSLGSSSRHSSGRRLCDVADLVLDTHVPVGDAVATVSGFDHPVGALSTIAAATLMQALVSETAGRLGGRGFTADQIHSHNHSGHDDNGAHDTMEAAVRAHALLLARRWQVAHAARNSSP